jgi:hypothetical protein
MYAHTHINVQDSQLKTTLMSVPAKTSYAYAYMHTNTHMYTQAHHDIYLQNPQLQIAVGLCSARMDSYAHAYAASSQKNTTKKRGNGYANFLKAPSQTEIQCINATDRDVRSATVTVRAATQGLLLMI